MSLASVLTEQTLDRKPGKAHLLGQGDGSGGLKTGLSLTRGHSPPPESGGTLVLVSQDGIQRPPLHFPQGGHLLSFLSCLENGLLPRGQLEPPLWTQQGKVSCLGRLWVQGWVKEGLLSSFLHRVLRKSPGWDCALSSLTICFLCRARFSPSYGNAAAFGPLMRRSSVLDGQQTMCSGSSTPDIGMSTVSVLVSPVKDARGV